MEELLHKKRRLTSFQIIILGFAGVILFGAILLMLPISSKSGMITPFMKHVHRHIRSLRDRSCGTGHCNLLVCVWPGCHHSADSDRRTGSCYGSGILCPPVGQKNITDAEKYHAGGNCSAKSRRNCPLTYFILKATVLFELLGALAMMPVFCRDFGIKGVWMSFFHSISAFCNAGFDLMGSPDSLFPSLTAYIGDPVINITIMLLIIIGGIGFLTWEDIYTHRQHFKRYRMQSKVILLTTALLIAVPAAFFFFYDFADMPIGERILSSFFQSVTPRTAGYNTANLAAMTGAGQAIMIMLMLIGGSPGSTAGGMKQQPLRFSLQMRLQFSAAKTTRSFSAAELTGIP